jgi:hypothetical protein
MKLGATGGSDRLTGSGLEDRLQTVRGIDPPCFVRCNLAFHFQALIASLLSQL